METYYPWHTLTVDRSFDLLESGPTGLAPEEAEKRLEKFGPNELPTANQISPWTILAAQFKNILIIILLIATAASAFFGQLLESVVITIIVIFAILLGFIQEYRAERAIEALRKMAAPTATVLRDGIEMTITAGDIAPGDIIVLHTGDRVPADARLIEAPNLKIDESSLTGESVPVEKSSKSLSTISAPIGDRNNMVFSGSLVTYGRGRALVCATGMETEFGKITGMLLKVESGKTPLQKNLDRLGKILAMAALVVVLVIVVLGLIRGEPLLQMFMFGIALAVAAVPEALPAVVTISLAIGVQRMAKRNALIRHLPTVETLGCASVICSDKTGTLTKGEMTVRKVYIGGGVVEITGSGYDPAGEFLAEGKPAEPGNEMEMFLKAATLVNDSRLIHVEDQWRIKGDPTEGALVVLAGKAGLNKTRLEEDFPRVYEIPFTSENKRMTTLHKTPEGIVAYSKGAPEVIIASCNRLLTKEGELELDGKGAQEILGAAHAMATCALRVLAIAYKPGAHATNADKDMVFIGLAGMIDPPRMEVKSSIQSCEKAGIKAIMITGDHPMTAGAIARELGLLKNGHVVTGVEMDSMSDEELERKVAHIEVYARVSPEHKLRVVTAWQKRGNIVAMTGDGVNDAPALKKADIGVAMGITGTDVTKEAADMMLTDDNFTSIVGALEEGRGIFSNIKKYLMYLISANTGEIGLMAGATLAGLPLPLTAVQLLYVNLATDGLPALALSVDPPEDDLMSHPPRDAKAGIFSKPVVILMLVGGVWSAVVNFSLFTWALNSGMETQRAMTMVFVALVLIQFVAAYCFRSDRYSIIKRPFSNKWLNLSVILQIAQLPFVIYVPFLQGPFGTFSFTYVDWIIVVSLALTIAPVLEITKWMTRRGWWA